MTEISVSNTYFISILMSSFNNEDTIQDAISSVIYQTNPNFELILIDDGSTDKTRQIMEKFVSADPRVKMIVNPINIGKSFSINMGALVARGEYLAIADADDVWIENKIEIQVNKLVENPKIDVLGGQLIRFGNWGKSITPTKLPLENEQIQRKFSSGIMAINNPTSIIRRASFLSIGGYRSYYRRNEDFDLFLRMHKRGFIFENLSEVLIEYRTSERFQSIRYWITAEIGRNQILLINSNLLVRMFPLIRFPKFCIDWLRLILIYVRMRFQERDEK